MKILIIINLKHRNAIAAVKILAKIKTPKAVNFVAYSSALNAVKSRGHILNSKKLQKVKLKLMMKKKRATFAWFVIENSSSVICYRTRIYR